METEQFEEGQIVLCTVDKVIGTTVFVKIQGDGEGTITLSEIAPGRIRNLRDYVVPNKQIVCKILGIKNNSIHLSLRRVTVSEKKELLEKVNKEKSYLAILKTVIGKDNPEKTIEKINQDYSIPDFFEEIKNNPKVLDKYLNKEQSEKIKQILESKKEKPKEIKQIFKLSNKSPNGIIIIKDILNQACKNKCEIKYLAAGKYSLHLTGEDFKALKSENNKIIDFLETSAKKSKCEFSVEKN
jgi:translation initiation factor 2 alpha subunit (eIF-2alpha)